MTVARLLMKVLQPQNRARPQRVNRKPRALPGGCRQDVRDRHPLCVRLLRQRPELSPSPATPRGSVLREGEEGLSLGCCRAAPAAAHMHHCRTAL